jgi:hypothetical protein
MKCWSVSKAIFIIVVLLIVFGGASWFATGTIEKYLVYSGGAAILGVALYTVWCNYIDDKAPTSQ